MLKNYKQRYACEVNKNEVTVDKIFEEHNKDNDVGGFLSTVNFFDDLIEISE